MRVAFTWYPDQQDGGGEQTVWRELPFLPPVGAGIAFDDEEVIIRDVKRVLVVEQAGTWHAEVTLA